MHQGSQVHHHPSQQVNTVYRLINQGAAVLQPRSTPLSLLRVILVEIPPHSHRGMRKLPKPAFLKCPAKLPNRGIRPTLMNCTKLDSGIITSLNQCIDLCKSQTYWFLNHHVFPSACSIDPYARVITAGSRNAHHINVIAVNEPMIVVYSFASIKARELVGSFRNDVTNTNQLGAIKFQQRPGMIVGYSSASYQSKPQRFISHPRILQTLEVSYASNLRNDT